MYQFVPGITQILGGSPIPKIVTTMRRDVSIINQWEAEGRYEGMVSNIDYFIKHGQILDRQSQADPENPIGHHSIQVKENPNVWYVIC